MKANLFLFFAIFIPQVYCYAQNSKSISVLYEKRIETGLNDYVLAEPHLSINPLDPDHLLIGAYFINPMDSSDKGYGCMSLVSRDGGKNWKYFKFPVQGAADPWCIINKKGEAVFSLLSGGDSSALFVYNSKDGGFTWDEEILNLGKNHDHQTMIVDDSRGKFAGNVFVTSIMGNTIFLARLSDDGRQLLSQHKYNFSNLGTNTLTVNVSIDGTLYIPFVTFLQNSVEQSVFLKERPSWLITSDDGGANLSVPKFISQMPGGRGFPVLAVDKTDKEFKDRLYYVESSHSESSIYLSYSPDKGKKWTIPKKVKNFSNKPDLQRPFFTAIPQAEVNNRGVLGLAWIDRTDDTTNQCQYTYFAASLDGGKTFLPNTRVSKSLSCPEKNSNNGWAGRRWKAGGDYMGLVSKPDGNFILVWCDSRNGKFELYMSEIMIN